MFLAIHAGQIRQFTVAHNVKFHSVVLVLGYSSQEELKWDHPRYDVLIADEIYSLYDTSIEKASVIICGNNELKMTQTDLKIGQLRIIDKTNNSLRHYLGKTMLIIDDLQDITRVCWVECEFSKFDLFYTSTIVAASSVISDADRASNTSLAI